MKTLPYDITTYLNFLQDFCPLVNGCYIADNEGRYAFFNSQLVNAPAFNSLLLIQPGRRLLKQALCSYKNLSKNHPPS